MKLHSPPFERALRRRVRQAVRALPESSRRSGKYRRGTNQRFGAAFLLLLFSAFFGIIVYDVMRGTGHLATALAFVSLWTTAKVFYHVIHLRAKLYAARDLPALRHLPVLEETAFRWQFEKYLRGTLFSLFDIIVGFAVLGAHLQFGGAQYLVALVLAVLCWAMMVALSILCAQYLMAIHGYVVLGLSVGSLVLLLGQNYFAPAALRLLDHAAPVLNLLLPTGWVVSLFQLLLPHPQWVLLALIFPIAGMLLAAWDALAFLRKVYHFREAMAAEAPDILPGQVPPPLRAPAQNPLFVPLPEAPLRVGLTTIEEIITNRAFLAPAPSASGGWLETTLGRWFTPREKDLAEFVYPQGLTLTRPWRRLGRNLVLTALAVVLAAFVHSNYRDVIQDVLLVGGLFVTLSQLVMLTLTSGRAFQGVNCSGVVIPMYAAYAIGFRELTNLLLKVTVLQIPYCLIYTMTGGAMVAHVLGAPETMGLAIGLRAGFLLGAVRFLGVALSFSSGTNDGSGISFRAFGLFLLMAFGGFSFLFSALFALTTLRPSLAWPACGWGVLSAYVTLRIYQWFYHSSRFDLMSLPRR